MNQELYERLERADLDERQFTEIFAKFVGAALKTADVVSSEPSKLLVKMDGSENQLQINLESIWKLCQTNPAQRLEIVESYISKMKDMAALPNQLTAELSELVVPLIRTTVELEELNRQFNNMLVHHSIGADLCVVYGINMPHAVGYLSLGERSDLEMTDGELLERSLSNLKAIIGGGGKVQIIGGPELWGIECGFDFESSLLLNNKFMNNLAEMVKGNLLVAVPSRRALFVCGTESASAVKKLEEIAGKFYDSDPHPVSPRLYRYESGSLSLFDH